MAGVGGGRPVEPHDHQGDLAGGGADHRSRTDRAVLLSTVGSAGLRRAALDWHQLQNEYEAFFLRIYGAGDYRWKGADLGVIVTKGRMQRRAEGEADTLTIRAKHLIDSIRDQYTGQPLAGAEVSAALVAKAPSMAK